MNKYSKFLLALLAVSFASIANPAWAYDKISICVGKENGTKNVRVKLALNYKASELMIYYDYGHGFSPGEEARFVSNKDGIDFLLYYYPIGSHVDRHTGEAEIVTNQGDHISAKCTPIP